MIKDRLSGSRFSSQSGLAFEMAPLHACVGSEVETSAIAKHGSVYIANVQKYVVPDLLTKAF
jgi:hypothetical protein